MSDEVKEIPTKDDQIFYDEKLLNKNLESAPSALDELSFDDRLYPYIPCASPSKKRSINRLQRRDCNQLRGVKEYNIAKTMGTTRYIPAGAGTLVDAAGLDAWQIAARATVVFVDLIAEQIVGTVARLAVSALFGPIGAIVGVVIGVVVDIILEMVHGTGLASDTDPLGILRKTFFGDAKKKGNEKCEGAGHSNCTILLGATTISGAFKWKNKEAIAFLIKYNGGYPITVDDMAKGLATANYDTPAPADAPFYVNCSRTQTQAPQMGVDYWTGRCNEPVYSLRPELIRLPESNRTASAAFADMISRDNPNGDCKLVNDAASTKKYPLPDGTHLITHGEPVAIECGLRGRGVQIDTDPDAVTETPGSSNNSTDGLEHSPPAPKQSNFTDLCTSGGVRLQGDSQDHSACFSSGTYNAWQGADFTGSISLKLAMFKFLFLTMGHSV